MTAILLRTYDELLSTGWTPRSIRDAVGTKRLVRIRHGVYADGVAMSAAFPAAKVIARARAAQLATAEPLVFSHETAAALHGLAVYRPSADRVHTIAPPARPGALAGLVRHRGEAHGGTTMLHGLLVTSIPQTVADVARTASFEQAVVIADGGLRSHSMRAGGEYDESAASALSDSIEELVARSAHGRRRAHRVLRFADGRAQLPGESISRIRLLELGFRDVAIQRRVPGPDGRSYFVDFAIDDANAFGEFDGSIKYVDGRMLDGRTTADVFDAEKQREDWIRGTTHRLLARWGWPHISTAAHLGARLRAFNIRAPA